MCEKPVGFFLLRCSYAWQSPPVLVRRNPKCLVQAAAEAVEVPKSKSKAGAFGIGALAGGLGGERKKIIR